MLPSIHLVVVIDPLGGAPLGGADVIAGNIPVHMT